MKRIHPFQAIVRTGDMIRQVTPFSGVCHIDHMYLSRHGVTRYITIKFHTVSGFILLDTIRFIRHIPGNFQPVTGRMSFRPYFSFTSFTYIHFFGMVHQDDVFIGIHFNVAFIGQYQRFSDSRLSSGSQRIPMQPRILGRIAHAHFNLAKFRRLHIRNFHDTHPVVQSCRLIFQGYGKTAGIVSRRDIQKIRSGCRPGTGHRHIHFRMMTFNLRSSSCIENYIFNPKIKVGIS